MSLKTAFQALIVHPPLPELDWLCSLLQPCFHENDPESLLTDCCPHHENENPCVYLYSLKYYLDDRPLIIGVHYHLPTSRIIFVHISCPPVVVTFTPPDINPDDYCPDCSK